MSLQSPAVRRKPLGRRSPASCVLSTRRTTLSICTTRTGSNTCACVRELHTAAEELVFWLDAEWENGVHSHNGRA